MFSFDRYIITYFMFQNLDLMIYKCYIIIYLFSAKKDIENKIILIILLLNYNPASSMGILVKNEQFLSSFCHRACLF